MSSEFIATNDPVLREAICAAVIEPTCAELNAAACSVLKADKSEVESAAMLAEEMLFPASVVE
jgi:hypothetical protein